MDISSIWKVAMALGAELKSIPGKWTSARNLAHSRETLEVSANVHCTITWSHHTNKWEHETLGSLHLPGMLSAL